MYIKMCGVSSVCVCVCGEMHKFMYVCIYLHVCACRKEVDMNYLQQFFSTLVFGDKVLSLNLELTEPANQ